jgi:hypothetical protein
MSACLTVLIALQFVVSDIQKDFLDVEPKDPEEEGRDDKIEEYSDAFEACGMRWCGASLADCSNMGCSCLKAVLILCPSSYIAVVERFNCETELDAGN